MLTEKVTIVAIICATVVAVCLIGSICDVVKKGKDKHERDDNDSI